MILIQGKQEIVDHHRLSVQTGKFHADWIQPVGTNYLLGEDLAVEVRDSLTVKGSLFSGLSLTSPYRILSCRSLLHIECPAYVGHDQWAAVKADQPGRLSYIDGCSNTNLIAPLRNGDPCLNYLYLPAGINQSAHVHPTARIGLISGGRGFARYWAEGEAKTIPLETGVLFWLPRFTRHSFHTESSYLSVMVFHPDSEGGPLDEANPMFSRTYRQAH